MNVSFYNRPSKVNRQGLAPIECRIIINGEQWMFPTERKEYPEVYTKLLNSKRDNDLKQYLNEVRNLINASVTSLMADGMPVNKDNLRQYMRNGGRRKVDSICDHFEKVCNLVKGKMASGLTLRTYEKYTLVKDDFFKFLGNRVNDPITSLSNIEVEEYVTTLQQRFDSATVVSKIQKLKYILKYANMENLFLNVRVKKENKPVEFLTAEEVERIRKVDIGIERIEKVRDCFLFQCNTALAFTDMAHLTREDIQEKDGVKFISKGRMKTDTKFFVPLTDEAIRILEKYDYQLPVISNQRYNSYIKEVAALAHISKNVHSHSARHTALTLLLNQGLPIEIVSKFAGHANISITNRVYAKIQDMTVVDAFKKFDIV